MKRAPRFRVEFSPEAWRRVRSLSPRAWQALRARLAELVELAEEWPFALPGDLDAVPLFFDVRGRRVDYLLDRGGEVFRVLRVSTRRDAKHGEDQSFSEPVGTAQLG